MDLDNLRTLALRVHGLDHQLADCLWSVIILAHHYQVDLESAFTATMAELVDRLAADLDGSSACDR